MQSTINWWKILLWVVVLIAILGFLYAVRGILLPFFLAFVIAILLEPTIGRLRRRGVPRAVAILLVFTLFFAGATIVIVKVAPMAAGQLGAITGRLQSFTKTIATNVEASTFDRWNPVYRASDNGSANPVDQLLVQFSGPLEQVGIPADRRLLVQQYVEPHRKEIANKIQSFFSGFINIALNASSQLLMLLFTPLLVLLILLDIDNMKVRSASWIPTSIRAETIGLVREVGSVFMGYLRGVMLNFTVYSCVMSVVLSVLGVPYAIPFALLAAAVYLIPYFGTWIALISILLGTGLSGVTSNMFLHFGSPWTFAVVVSLLFAAVSLVYDALLTPRFLGKSVGLSPLVSMFVVFSFAALFGLIGMLIAYPVAGSIKVILTKLMNYATQSTPSDVLGLPATPLRHRVNVES
ncbi:MAG: AI-2E family transporter [Armatimonadetes bacterium]|nr:AI-2E family transporter [Armatimonadota bacterium]